MADRELDDLAKYLLHVAIIEDMETLNHKDWKRVVRALPPH
jgi:ubiquitin-like domain-containing CTD phosphatase 1